MERRRFTKIGFGSALIPIAGCIEPSQDEESRSEKSDEQKVSIVEPNEGDTLSNGFNLEIEVENFELRYDEDKLPDREEMEDHTEDVDLGGDWKVRDDAGHIHVMIYEIPERENITMYNSEMYYSGTELEHEIYFDDLEDLDIDESSSYILFVELVNDIHNQIAAADVNIKFNV